MPEDLIVELDGAPVTGVDDIQRVMVGEAISATVSLEILRQGRPLTIELVPAELDGWGVSSGP